MIIKAISVLSFSVLATTFTGVVQAEATQDNPVQMLKVSSSPYETLEKMDYAQKQVIIDFINNSSEEEVAKVFKDSITYRDRSDYYALWSGIKEKVACVAQVGTAKCLTAAKDAGIAGKIATQYFPNTDSLNGGKGDAFRHCYWNARMVHTIGNKNAKIIADNHEYYGSGSKKDKDMDLANNATGRQIGAKTKTHVASLHQCKAKALKGQLVTLNRY